MLAAPYVPSGVRRAFGSVRQGNRIVQSATCKIIIQVLHGRLSDVGQRLLGQERLM